MPLYEYQCDACAHRFEVIQKYSDPLVDVCPKCAGVVRKLVSSPAFQFKGSGWYITDYARKGSGGGANASGDGSGASKAEGQSSDGAKSGGDSTSGESKSGESKSGGETKGGGDAKGGSSSTPSTPPSKKTA